MRPDEMKAILDRRPFEPVRLHISSGQTVDIKHPEMAIVSRSLVVAKIEPLHVARQQSQPRRRDPE